MKVKTLRPLNIFLFIVILVQITNLKINFLPRNLILFTFFIGIIFFVIELVKRKIIDRNFFIALLLLILPLPFLCFSILANQYFDFDFLKEIIIFNLVSFFSAYAIVKMNKSLDLTKSIAWFIGICVTFQLLISLLFFLIPSGFQIIATVFELTQDADKAISLNEFRMVGIGAGFFQSGILNSFVLVMLAGLIVSKNTNNNEKNVFFLMMILISLLGLFSSRSTIIGIVISLSLILVNIYKSKAIVVSSFLILALIILLMPMVSGLDKGSRILELFRFGTQFILDFNNSQAAKSTGELNDMWGIWPNSLKTWLMGDVKYREGELYYMHTDVGYARLIYAVGIMGTFFILVGQIYLILKLDQDYFNKQTKYCMILVLLVCEIKGVTLFTPFLSLLFFASIFSQRRKKLYITS
ncbi:hypothetical protein [Acinetobacter guillouiae]|jgi:hypothetical protein|uniref:hypothetical protein n=1 Tax=Acinetobacter guillouiae TaxID=106649 RepID=UPI0028D285F1|nr:hypothetical protein [Acinetobacter guillouiae]